MQVRPIEDQDEEQCIPVRRDNPDWTGTVTHMHKNLPTHTHTCSKGPQIVPAGCYDCMSVPAVIEMKACPQEGFFFPPLSICTNATPSTITMLLSSTTFETWEFLADKHETEAAAAALPGYL